jgi:hypothetical protein
MGTRRAGAVSSLQSLSLIDFFRAIRSTNASKIALQQTSCGLIRFL